MAKPTFAEEMRSAAVAVFDALTGAPEIVEYLEVETAGGYVAGGNLAPTETPHSLRIIKEERSGLAMAIADEANANDDKYLFVKSELSVGASKGDKIKFTDGEVRVIEDFEDDAVDAVTTLFLRKS